MSSKRMECPTCAFSWLRDPAHADKTICPKCQQPLAKGATQKRMPGEASTIKIKTSEHESGHCPKNPDNGPHKWKFGKCTYCRRAEGKVLKKAGAVANPGGKAGCPKGGKHLFKFSKCKKCGVSEFAAK